MRGGQDRAVNVIDGELIKPMVILSLPIIITNMMQVGYNLADTFWVGRLGQEAVSALSFSWAIIFLLITLSAGFAVAGNVLVAQNKGAGKVDRVDHVAGQTIGFVFILSAFFSIVGYLSAPFLLELIGAVPDTAEYSLALEYTRTMFLGIPFIFGFFIFQGLLQGWGDTRTPMYLMTLGVTLNILIDPIFILGFKDNVLFSFIGLGGAERYLYSLTGFSGFGVQGAAFATILSRGIGAVIAIFLLLFGWVGIKPSLRDFILKRETIEKIFRIGAPASIEQSTLALAVTLLTALVALTGQEAVAAYGIGNRLTSLVFLPAVGLARGTETVVGQNLGAEQIDRAWRAVFVSTGLIAVVLTFVSYIAVVYSEPITSVFITGEKADLVVSIASDYLRIVGVTYVFMGAFRVFQGGFRGSGSTVTAMSLSVLGLIVFRVPSSYLLIEWYGWGARGVWISIAGSNVAILVIAFIWFLRGGWTKGVIDRGKGISGDGLAEGDITDGGKELVDD